MNMKTETIEMQLGQSVRVQGWTQPGTLVRVGHLCHEVEMPHWAGLMTLRVSKEQVKPVNHDKP